LTLRTICQATKEVKTVNSLSNILPWLERNVEGMRQSRRKTLAGIVEGAMRMQGTGVLALGRAMSRETRQNTA
jgi:hypothetical protein